MQLTRFTDYALRTLIYAAIHERPVSLDEISSSFGISRNHLAKVVGTLEKGHFVTTKRGPGGGISLSRSQEDINLAEVIQCTEPTFDIAECFNKDKNSCPIAGCCVLTGVLAKANVAFINELSKHSLSSISKNKEDLLARLAP